MSVAEYPEGQETPPQGQARAGAVFVTTHWSIVLGARDKDSSDSTAALERLCRIYWYPLYAHVRRLGHASPDAEDLTQEFFARLLSKNYLEAADQAKGRFRTFLLVALDRFLANEWDRAQARKRGGGCSFLPLDTVLAERLYAEQSFPELPREREYERRWALTLVEQAMGRLRGEYERAGKTDQFERLKGFLGAGQGSIAYGPLAKDMQTTEGAARVMVYRLRRRFREIFSEEVAHTLADPRDLPEEMQHLMEVLTG
jgi:DNA-directed RNA polymerase specialized sigma24 family protein